MPQHSSRTTYSRWRWLPAAGAVAVVGPLLLVVTTLVSAGAAPFGPGGCAALRVVTAASFAPVLTELAPAVAEGPGCARLEVVVADGRGAAARVAETGADLWVPDDAAWRGGAPGPGLAADPAGGAGTVVATSPLLLVADPDTAAEVTAAGAGWRALADLVTAPRSGVRLVAHDPGGSGEGMLGLGAVGEAVWLDEGMDASADVLAGAVPRTRLVTGREPPLPARPGEVGLVAERTLLQAGPERLSGLTVLAPADRTAELRHSWYPSAAAAADPGRARALERLAAALAGPDGDGPIARAGLRRPGAGPPPGAAAVAPAGLPPVVAPAFDVLGPHHVDHVLATWYPADRRADVLVAVDVSGSMWAVPPGADASLIEVVREGVGVLADLLPDASRLALWEFGTHLDGSLDHRELLGHDELAGGRRTAVAAAIAGLTPSDTGTGLHDTVLEAYLAARAAHRAGTPSQVVVFTDGRNEADDPTRTLRELERDLAAAADPERPVALAVVTFGDEPDAAALAAALEPVGGYVDRLTTADEVGAAFIHVAAGGLHG